MFYIKLRRTYFGNFSIRFWGKNSQFLLGNGSFYRTCMQGILCPGPSLGMSLMHTMQLYAWFQWFVSMYIKIMLFSFLNIAWYVQEFNFTSNESVLYIYIYTLYWQYKHEHFAAVILKYSTLQYNASILMALQQPTDDRFFNLRYDCVNSKS